MRTVFCISIDNQIDIITNSSSELFVMRGDSKKDVIKLIENIYPNYRLEYEELKSLYELDLDELSTYISYRNDLFCYNSDGSQVMSICESLGLKPHEAFDNWYEYFSDNNSYVTPYLSDIAKYELRNKFPKNTFFLFSYGENPNYEMQERLSSIGVNYHLG